MPSHRDTDIQQKIIHRLKISRGHLNKVIKMTEEQEYCIDIIHQSQAIQGALKEIDILLLNNHLKTCVISQMKDGKAEAVEELMTVFKKQG